MKLWYVTLLSFILAVVSGLLLPKELGWIESAIWVGGDLYGYYIAFLSKPLLFFSMVISVAYLKRRHILFKVLFQSLFLGFLLSLSFAAVGLLLVRVLPLPRLVILFEQSNAVGVVSFTDIMMRILPRSFVSVFMDGWFLPLFFLALVLGLNMGFDMEAVEPTFNLFDSLSRIFFQVILKSMFVVFIPTFFLTLRLVHSLRHNDALEYFKPFLWVIVAMTTFIVLLFSVTYYIASGRRSPIGWLYGAGSSIVLSFLGVPSEAGYGLYAVQSHKNHGVKRDLAGTNIPLLMLFVRSGTALVLAASLMMIIKSYSVLEISSLSMIRVVLASSITSFFLPISGNGDVFREALTFASALYPNDLQSGLRSLEPVLPYLSQLASLIDMLVLAFLLRIFAHRHDFLRSRSYI